MKKIILFFSLFLISFANVFATNDCDQTFYGTLRHGKVYKFYDVFYNNGTTVIGINSVDVHYEEEYDYNGSSSFPIFNWTDWFINKSYILNPGDSRRVIEADSGYPIIYHPATRNYNNFFLKYTAKFYSSSDGQNWNGPKYHTECKYYEISWCGDGVLDTSYGEVCDPNDTSKEGWGTGGCNAECQPVEASSCNSLTVDPDEGHAPLTSSVTCTGYKVDTFKIDCGNGQVFTADGSNSGVESLTRVCNYASAGTYNPTCYINDTITNSSCQKTVDLGCLAPAIRVDKSDFNLDDLDEVVGNDEQTVNKGTKAVFKIKVTNSGNEALKDIKLTDAVAPNCGGSVTLPNTYPSTWSDFSTGGNGNKTDDILEPGEYFEYTCEKGDTQNDYINVVVAEGTGVQSHDEVSDSDDTQVYVEEPQLIPSVQIDKRDANPDDLDGVTGNDTQKVDKGTKAVFKIRVTNNGEESLKNIRLTDTIAPNCGGSVTLPNTYPSTWSNFNTGGNGNKTDNILEPGEYFEYTCEKEDTQVEYTNTAKVDALGVSSAQEVSDSDTTVVLLRCPNGCPSIKIDKRDANPDDLDGIVGNDSQLVSSGSGAIFKIRVTNSGEEDLKNIVLTDALSQNCEGSVTLPNTYPSTWSNFEKGGNGNLNDGVLSPGEYFEYTCEKENIQAMLVNIAEVEAIGVNTGIEVRDVDDTCVDVPPYTPTPSVQIDKRDANAEDLDEVIGNDTQTVNKGSKAIFKIRVTNNGEESLKNIRLTDTIAPNCGGEVTLPSTYPSTWSNFSTGGIGNKGDIILEPGEYFEYTCEKLNTQEDYGNTASVDALGVTSRKEVSDNDQTEVKVQEVSSSCDSLSASPMTGVNVLNSSVSCSGTKAQSFKIDCGNGQVFTGTGSGEGSDSFDAVCNYVNQGTYTPTCYVNETITNNSCQKTVSVTGSSSSSSSSSSGGGSSPHCTKIEVDKKTSTGTGLTTGVTCYGNSKAKRFKLDCGNGQEFIGDGESKTGFYGMQFSATCEYEELSKKTYIPQCFVGKKSTTVPRTSSFACRTKITLGGDSYCGDGVLQRPNSKGEYEQCERALNADGTVGDFPSFCSSDCKIRYSSIPKSCPTETCFLTIPNEGSIIFGPKDSIIIGNNMNPYREIAITPYIQNESSYDLYFDKLCVTKRSGKSVIGVTPQCVDIGDFYPGQIVRFPNYPNFFGDTKSILSEKSYGDNILTTTIKHEGKLYTDAYFSQDLEVRVAKPSIATTGGGTSYVGNKGDISDLEDIAEGKADEEANKNFVGTSVGDLSSHGNDEKVGQDIEDKLGDEGEKYGENMNDIQTTVGGGGTITSLNSVVNNYNGIKNVYILKNQNLEISSIPKSISGPRTYIIEDGNLIIKGNLLYDDNIAFVLKGGNIVIHESVTEISGTYISIKNSDTGAGGQIRGIKETNNILSVQGNLYGDIAHLVSTRTYIKKDEKGHLSVGTIVSFTSGLFRKPAPLVSEFIDQYMNSQKIAK